MLKKILKTFFIGAVFIACNKSTNQPTPLTCTYENDPTMLTLTNRLAIVKNIYPNVYVIQFSSLDSLLSPCNLPDNFKSDSLAIKISGDIKPTIHNAYDLFRTYNFYIQSIVKQ